MIVHSEEVRGTSPKRPRLYGHIHTLDSGVKLYMATRKHREIYRGGVGSISHAMSKEVAGWAIDENLLFGLRAKRIEYIGVHVRDTGDKYMSEIKWWFDWKKVVAIDYTGVGRGGSKQRVLPLHFFTLAKGVVPLEVTA